MASEPVAAEGPGIERPLLLAAATVVLVIGLRYASDVLAPVIFALVAVVVAYPIQRKLLARGSHPLLAMLAAWAAIYAVFLSGALMLLLAMVQLANELPQYEAQIQDAISSVQSALGASGTTDLSSQLSASNVVAVVQAFLGGILGVLGNAVTVVAVVFFLVIDALRFPAKYAEVDGDRGYVTRGWSKWASETRVYLGVATVFGLIVAVLDSALLVVLDVPLVLSWGLLAFVTNYIPNIGFVIGLIPPAVLGGLTGGWETALWVVVGYSVINFTIQEFIQPKIIGDSVNLAATVTFVGVFFWAWVIGPLGAILCTPLSLFVRSVMLEPYPRSRWLADLVSADAPHEGAAPEEERPAAASGEPEPGPAPAG